MYVKKNIYKFIKSKKLMKLMYYPNFTIIFYTLQLVYNEAFSTLAVALAWIKETPDYCWPRRINLYTLHKYVDTINILLKLQL